jgi:solute carrier family 25 protein 38
MQGHNNTNNTNNSTTNSSSSSSSSSSFPAAALVSGCLSGAVSGFLLQPLDVVKTRAQVGTGHPKYWPLVRAIYAQHGLRGFWHGLTASLYRTVPGVGLYFAGLQLWQPRSPLRTWHGHELFDGALVRSMAGLALMPFTVVKARMESGRFRYQSVSHALVNVVQTEGALGMLLPIHRPREWGKKRQYQPFCCLLPCLT